jgi:hypothetical protein
MLTKITVQPRAARQTVILVSMSISILEKQRAGREGTPLLTLSLFLSAAGALRGRSSGVISCGLPSSSSGVRGVDACCKACGQCACLHRCPPCCAVCCFISASTSSCLLTAGDPCMG